MTINYGDIPDPPGYKYLRCSNSLTGKHKWVEPIGKNANKPKGCVYCSNLEVDLRKETTNG